MVGLFMAVICVVGAGQVGIKQQTWQHDRGDSRSTRSRYRTMRQIEHHKGGRERDWRRKMGELDGEGEWINKTVLSASPGPAGSIKWVDMGRWVSPFSPSSLPFLPLSSSPTHMADSTSSPPPALLRTPYWNGLSPTHKPTLACTSIPRPLSHVLFTVRLRPTALQDERPLPPPLCPDVVQIIRGKPVFFVCVITTSRKKAVGASSQRWCQRRREEGWTPACTEEHFHRLTLIKKKKAPQTAAMATVNIEKRIPVQGVSGEQRALQASVRRPQQKRVIKCAQMIEQNPPGGTIHATEVSKRTATSSFQKPRALPACLLTHSTGVFNTLLLCSP